MINKYAVLNRDRTRVEITLLFVRRDHWICVEKKRQKFQNFEKMRRKCDGFFMEIMTSEVKIIGLRGEDTRQLMVTIRAEIFHGHQTTTKSYFLYFVIVLPISDLFSPPKKSYISTHFDATFEEKLCVGKNASA